MQFCALQQEPSESTSAGAMEMSRRHLPVWVEDERNPFHPLYGIAGRMQIAHCASNRAGNPTANCAARVKILRERVEVMRIGKRLPCFGRALRWADCVTNFPALRESNGRQLGRQHKRPASRKKHQKWRSGRILIVIQFLLCAFPCSLFLKSVLALIEFNLPKYNLISNPSFTSQAIRISNSRLIKAN